MIGIVTVSTPHLQRWVREIINTTNYRDMMTEAQFLSAALARMYGDEHAALDVLFEDLYRTHPELREWPYEDEDDLLLANHLTTLANTLMYILTPMLPSPLSELVVRYHSHAEDTLTVIVE